VQFDRLSNRVIGCAIEVHRQLGPGLLESVYEQCLSYELQQAGIPFQTQIALPIEYKQVKLDCAYRIDMLVDNQLIVELKIVETLLKVHDAQLLSYMKLAKMHVGILINFNVDILRKGIKRLVL
jgi:GxxExxY protein